MVAGLGVGSSQEGDPSSPRYSCNTFHSECLAGRDCGRFVFVYPPAPGTVPGEQQALSKSLLEE